VAARARPAVLTEAVLAQTAALPVVPVVPKVARVARVVAKQAAPVVAAQLVGAVVRPMEVPAASVEGQCWVQAGMGVPLRDLALRPMWAVFDRSWRHPALSH